MKLYDISMPITPESPVWPGDPPVSISPVKSIKQGDECNLSQLSIGVHTATHVDAPYHFLESGHKAGEIPIEVLIGPCRVIEISGPGPIVPSQLEDARVAPASRLLMKTDNSLHRRAHQKDFCRDFVALSVEAAEYIASLEIILAGIDYLSIEPFASQGAVVHKTLLSRNVVLLEGLDLSEVAEGEYELICLPVLLPGCEAAPARVLLRSM